jgi:hypothetical protein
VLARTRYDKAVKESLGEPTPWEDLTDDPQFDTPILKQYYDDTGGGVPGKIDKDDITIAADTFHRYVGAEVQLPTGDGIRAGRVKGWKRDREGRVVEKAAQNPILNTRVYDVKFEDGKVGEYAANVIAEHMVSVADVDGNQVPLLEAIVAHRKDGHAVEKADMYD